MANHKWAEGDVKSDSTCVSVAVVAWRIAAGGPAVAQDRAQEARSGFEAATQGVADIVVTPRKRDETSLSAPVIVSVVSAEQLDTRGINTVDGLTKLVPTLVSGEGSGAPQGIVEIRGFSGADPNPIADEAVARPSEKWRESPCAFVRPNRVATSWSRIDQVLPRAVGRFQDS